MLVRKTKRKDVRTGGVANCYEGRGPVKLSVWETSEQGTSRDREVPKAEKSGTVEGQDLRKGCRLRGLFPKYSRQILGDRLENWRATGKEVTKGLGRPPEPKQSGKEDSEEWGGGSGMGVRTVLGGAS